MNHSLLQTSPSSILCKQSVPVGRAPEQARLPVAFPDSGGEFVAEGSSPESGEVRKGLNVRVSWELLQTSPSPIPEQARLPVAFPDSGGEFREGPGELTKYIGETRLRGHLVMVILVKIDFGNAVICSLYINIKIFIYSADF